jgi:hypothetical protein
LLESRQAAAAARRLDDAFRSYLAERGAKPVPLAEMTTLVTMAAVRRDLYDEQGRATATAVRIIWTGDHVDAARRLQAGLAAATG